MRRAWSVLLLTGALLLLASLYLPWQKASCDSGQCVVGQGGTVAGLLNLFPGTLTVDGWSSGVGPAAALFALLLAAAAAIAMVRPHLSGRLALGQCALFAGYFGVAVGAQARSVAHQREIGMKMVHFHYAYGAYLGVTGAIVALLAAGAMRRRELGRHRSASRLTVLILGVGLLVAFLLPWERYVSPARVTFLGIASPAAVVAAALTLCLLVVWWRAGAGAHTALLLLAAAAALFTGAAFSSLTFPGSHAYGAWVGLGASGAIVALALIDGARIPRLELPRRHALATCGAAALLVADLFLPWQKACYEKASDFGPYPGRCVSTNGWTTAVGAAAAGLAVALVIVTLAPRRLAVSVIALAAGIGLLVATLGFQLEDQSTDGLRLSYGYGSTIGFAGAGLLLVLALVRLHVPAFDLNSVPVRLAPILACAAYLVVVVLSWWDVLPRHAQSALRFASLSWLTIAGALLAVWLLRVWARQIAGVPESDAWLVLIPLALLGLAALDLIRLRDDGMTWGRGAVVVLCLLLALLGRVEQRAGLENFRVPELLRVDRL